MDNQRLRSLTTGKLHTDIGYVYDDLEAIIGSPVMTHMIPNMLNCIKPWLVENVPDPRFWDNTYDPTHIGEYPLPTPTPEEQKAMFNLYFKQPNPLSGKDVIVVAT